MSKSDAIERDTVKEFDLVNSDVVVIALPSKPLKATQLAIAVQKNATVDTFTLTPALSIDGSFFKAETATTTEKILYITDKACRFLQLTAAAVLLNVPLTSATNTTAAPGVRFTAAAGTGDDPNGITSLQLLNDHSTDNSGGATNVVSEAITINILNSVDVPEVRATNTTAAPGITFTAAVGKGAAPNAVTSIQLKDAGTGLGVANAVAVTVVANAVSIELRNSADDSIRTLAEIVALSYAATSTTAAGVITGVVTGTGSNPGTAGAAVMFSSGVTHVPEVVMTLTQVAAQTPTTPLAGAITGAVTGTGSNPAVAGAASFFTGGTDNTTTPTLTVKVLAI